MSEKEKGPAMSPLHNPTPNSVTGTIRVYVAPCEPLVTEHADELHAVIESFLAALRLSMFPGKLGHVHDVARGEDGKADARFDVVELELGAFRVLRGMLAYFSLMVAPLGTMMAWCEPVGSTPNLLDTEAPLPVHRGPLPFHASFTVGGGGAAPPLAVEVVFARALTNEEKDQLDMEIRVWAALVQGGYPEADDEPGGSAMGPISVRYDDPLTLRLHAEALLASDACFEPLEALVVHWSATLPVVSLETE
jgi:hypothetical protein